MKHIEKYAAARNIPRHVEKMMMIGNTAGLRTAQKASVTSRKRNVALAKRLLDEHMRHPDVRHVQDWHTQDLARNQ